MERNHFMEDTGKAQREEIHNTLMSYKDYSKDEASYDEQLNFYFYADSQDNASNLAIELKQKYNYTVFVEEPGEQSDKWSVKGKTDPMSTLGSVLIEFSEEMEKLADQHDSTYDGFAIMTMPGYENTDPREALKDFGIDYYEMRGKDRDDDSNLD